MWMIDRRKIPNHQASNFIQHGNKACVRNVCQPKRKVGGGERESKYLLLGGNRTPQHPLHSRAKCEPDPNYLLEQIISRLKLAEKPFEVGPPFIDLAVNFPENSRPFT